MKPQKIYAEVLESGAISQFNNVLAEDYVTAAALMPDAHQGYTMPIGCVASCKDNVVPQFVGFDIGCGMSALKTPFTRNDIEDFKTDIFENIKNSVPVGFTHNAGKQTEWRDFPESTKIAKDIFEKQGMSQLGTLGGGNHFIEVGHDEEGSIWIIIHSGSRGLGHKVASHYMREAYGVFREATAGPEIEQMMKKFDKSQSKFKAAQPAKFAQVRAKKVLELKAKVAKVPNNVDNIKTICPLNVNTDLGRDYITDLNFALEYALENRKRMIERVYNSITSAISTNSTIMFKDADKEDTDLVPFSFINRNHNHAEFNKTTGEWIHRKGATHAENGMMGVIPGNMRDGSFIVRGKGHPDSLYSSSHGAGRILSRSKAKELLDLDDFVETMTDVVGVVSAATLDESPEAYKNIFEVMDLQKDLVDVVAYIKPLINVKG